MIESELLQLLVVLVWMTLRLPESIECVWGICDCHQYSDSLFIQCDCWHIALSKLDGFFPQNLANTAFCPNRSVEFGFLCSLLSFSDIEHQNYVSDKALSQLHMVYLHFLLEFPLVHEQSQLHTAFWRQASRPFQLLRIVATAPFRNSLNHSCEYVTGYVPRCSENDNKALRPITLNSRNWFAARWEWLQHGRQIKNITYDLFGLKNSVTNNKYYLLSNLSRDSSFRPTLIKFFTTSYCYSSKNNTLRGSSS